MSTTRPNVKGRWFVGLLAVALFVLHQDFWWWDNRSLVLGFLPIGLFYHAVFSLAAGGVWALANKFAWPEHIEEWAEVDQGDPSDEGGRP